VARDRQRAKQRKARRAQNPGPAPTQPRRKNVPGELEHASADIDEFEAALIEGAHGEAVADADTDAAADADTETVLPDEADAEAYPEQLSDEDFEELEDEIDEHVEDAEELEAEDDRGRRPAADATGAAATPARRQPAVPGQATQKGAGRFMAFLRASWAELQRVQWPDRRQVGQATAVVLGFVVIAGAYLGLADRVASEIVDLII
jgi:preprotein translocase subunit SecE